MQLYLRDNAILPGHARMIRGNNEDIPGSVFLGCKRGSNARMNKHENQKYSNDRSHIDGIPE
jgi:hypothetical protein